MFNSVSDVPGPGWPNQNHHKAARKAPGRSKQVGPEIQRTTEKTDRFKEEKDES